MDLPQDVSADLRVAAVAALSTIALTLASGFVLNVDVPTLARLSPIFVYFAYLFFGKGSTGSIFERARLWEALAVVVAAVTLLYYAL